MPDSRARSVSSLGKLSLGRHPAATARADEQGRGHALLRVLLGRFPYMYSVSVKCTRGEAPPQLQGLLV